MATAKAAPRRKRRTPTAGALRFVAAALGATLMVFPIYWMLVTAVMTLLSLAPMLAIFLLFQRYFVEGMTRSGLK